MNLSIFQILLALVSPVEGAPDQPKTMVAEEMLPCSKIREVSADPASIAQTLSNYRVKFEKVDDNSVKAFDGELFYYIDAYKNDEGYHSITFNISFENVKVGLAQINDWNQKRRFSRAYYTKAKLAVLEMDLNLVPGGMPDCQFQDNLAVWLDSLGKFHDTVYKLN